MNKLKLLFSTLLILSILIVPAVAQEDEEQVMIAAFGTGPGADEPQAGRIWTGGGGETVNAKLYIAPSIFNETVTEIVPYAATWESNEDFTVWTYTLVEDLLWSDGEALTADDWKFTAEFITDPDFTSNFLNHRNLAFDNVVGFEEKINGEAEELTGIQVIDDRTVEYTLINPDPRHFTTQYRTYFLPEHAIDFEPADFLTTDWFVNSDKQVGSGPFVVGDFVRDEFMTMLPNSNYFLGEPILDRLVFRFFGGDITAATLALQAGEIDHTYVNPEDIPALGDEVEIFSGSSYVPVYTDIHYRNEDVPDFWTDVRVRQAIMHAIDRNAITEEIMEGTHYPVPCPVPFEEGWPEDVNFYEYNPELAAQLLEEAGVDPADISMEWIGWSGYDTIYNNDALQAVQIYLTDIGITDFSHRFIDLPSFRERYTADGEWTFHYRGVGMPVYGADYRRAWSNEGAQGGDFKGFDMAEAGLEDAIAAIDSAPDTEAYFGAIQDFCALHNELLPDLQMWSGNRYGAVTARVQDFWWQPAPGGGPYIDNAHLWSIEEE